MGVLAGRARTILLLAAMLLAHAPAAMSQRGGEEYALKAVFLYNFCRFIEWPDRAFASPDAPLVIGLIGEDPFGSLLEETVKGESVRGRRIRVERYRRVSEIGACHLLFVAGAEAARADETVAAVAGRSVLTVGETETFLEQGGMIALIADRSRVRLRVSPARLRAANLAASSKLLRVAEIRP